MLENEKIIQDFKKSLIATVKSIGKSNEIEVNFVKDEPVIKGKNINLSEPNLKLIKNNLNYLRAEADSMALEFRLHDKEIHEKFLRNNDITDQIFNAVEQSRIEAKGSKIFKGIKLNILNKHKLDIAKNNNQKELINAFRYVVYSELTEEKLNGNYNLYKKLIKKELIKNYNNFFEKLN